MSARSIVAILLCGACGGGGAVTPSSSGVENRVPEAPRDEQAETAARRAPVPEATDPRERVLHVKAGSVWMMKPDGAEASQLTVRSHEVADEAPALSPRGDALAWSSARGGKPRIYVMSLADLMPEPITTGEGGGDGAPTWSPDGKRIAFIRGGPADRRDLYVIGADGSNLQLLVAGDDRKPEHAGAPAWSPDGKSIAFAADRGQGNGTRLWLADVATRAIRPLTPVRPGAWFVRDGEPSWSPDGKLVAFSSNRHATSSDNADDTDLYVIGADGSGLTRLTDDPGRASDPSFSPDGKRLFFVSTRDLPGAFESELWVMAASGGQQLRITRDERPQNRAPSAGRIAK